MYEIVKIKGVIKELSLLSRRVRSRIENAKDRKRYDLWVEKRAIGASTRVYLLAYAYLKGRKLREVEPHTRSFGRETSDVRDIVVSMTPCNSSRAMKELEEKLKKWFEEPVIPVPTKTAKISAELQRSRLPSEDG